MNDAGWHWLAALPRFVVPRPTMAGAIEIATALTASAAIALFVALAGSYLSDLPPAGTSQAEAQAAPRASSLLFCSVVAEGQRCIEEAS